MITPLTVQCPWCQADYSFWQIGDQEEESCFPAIGDVQRCESCKNYLIVKNITIPTILVEKDRSKEQDAIDREASKDRWKKNASELKLRYSVPQKSTLMCKIFGHKWECLAQSGYTDNSYQFVSGKFQVCVRCLHPVDTLKEDPDDHGYWARL